MQNTMEGKNCYCLTHIDIGSCAAQGESRDDFPSPLIPPMHPPPPQKTGFSNYRATLDWKIFAIKFFSPIAQVAKKINHTVQIVIAT